MDAIDADDAVSMSEFKNNPAQVLRSAGETPMAVLNHNCPALDRVTLKLLEELPDHDLVEIVRERLTRAHNAIDVDLDQI